MIGERQYPWDVLEIDETDDKKTIKKAYAVLIKQYKPDENPEKFQQIQAAYKQALQLAKGLTTENKVKTIHSNNVISQESKTQDEEDFILSGVDEVPEKALNTFNINEADQSEGFSLSQASEVDSELLALQKQQNELIENLFKQIHEMAFSSLVVKSKIESWKFIEDYFKIDDISLKPEIAATVFKKVAEYNLFQQQQNNTFLIRPEILYYFNSVFDWSSRWNEYQHHFPEHYFTVTLDLFDNKYKPPGVIDSLLFLFYRCIAFSIDVILFTLIVYVLEVKLFPNSQNLEKYNILGFIVFYLFSELLFKNHTSLGKKYIGLLVFDKFGNICSKKGVIFRHIVFQFIILPVLYLPFIHITINQTFLNYWFYFLIILNFITFILFRKLLHDFITNTWVNRN